MYKRHEDEEYKIFRTNVFKRDKYKCRFPGCKSKGRNVHHIVPYSKNRFLRTDPNNGISLCINHHKLVKGKEIQYARIFMEIIS